MANADTKSRIMDAAEDLFAEQGYAATSLRDITGRAEVNLAAVNYHFQSKEGLLEAVLGRHLGPMNEERLAALDAVESEAGGAAPLEAILRALLEPAFQRQHGKGAKLFRLLGRMHSETDEQLGTIFHKQFETVMKRFSRALQRSLPELGRDELAWRMHFVIGAMAHTLLWSQKPEGGIHGRLKGARPEAVLESLVAFGVAGLQAGSCREEKERRKR